MGEPLPPLQIPAKKRASVLAITIILAIAAFATASATTPLQSLAEKWSGTLNGAKPKIAVMIDLTVQ